MVMSISLVIVTRLRLENSEKTVIMGDMKLKGGIQRD